MRLMICFFAVLVASSSADDTESVQARIAHAMSAGPPEIAKSHAGESESHRRSGDVCGCRVHAVGGGFQGSQTRSRLKGETCEYIPAYTNKMDPDRRRSCSARSPSGGRSVQRNSGLIKGLMSRLRSRLRPIPSRCIRERSKEKRIRQAAAPPSIRRPPAVDIYA